MTQEPKQIDAPLVVTYTIAVLTSDHADRLFLMLDPYRNCLSWSRLYRPAMVYASAALAREAIDEITAGKHPQLVDGGAGADIATLRLLETQVHFRRMDAT